MPSEFQDGDLIEAIHLKQYSGEAYYSAAGAGSTASAYVASVTPAPLSAYPLGMVLNFKPNADSAAGPTLNVNGMGAKAIVKNGATPLAAADLKNGQVVSLVYDGINFQLVAASAAGGGASTGIDAANIGSGTVSNTEFGALDGVTGSIQTQLNGKAAISHTHAAADITLGQLGLARGGTGADLSATGGAGQVLKQNTAGGTISVGALSASDMPAGIDAVKIGSGNVSNTELGYLDGVTSALQTQLNGKAATSHTHAATDIASGTLGIARGGTGLSALGSALQSLRVNGAGTALEYFTSSSSGATSYCCVVQRSTNKYWGANYVRDAISWDTEILDASGMHSTSVNSDRIYLNRSGNWLVLCSLGFQNSTYNGAEPWFFSHLYKNTTEITGLPTRIGSSGTSEMHTVLVQVVPSNCACQPPYRQKFPDCRAVSGV